MRTWTIANGPVGSRTGQGAEACGCCGRQVPNGTPIQVIRIVGVAKARYRCVECADGDVDWQQVGQAKADLEARDTAAAAHAPIRLVPKAETGFTKLSESGKRFDPKLAAAGGDT